MKAISGASAAILVWALAAPVQAQVCGDVNGSATVTDTDAVQILRAAAGLSSTCTLRTCDLDVDGRITDTDGVLALRVAAQLPSQATCSEALVSQVLERVRLTYHSGGAPARQAHAAQSTVPCSGGGFTEFTDNGFVDFDCVEGDLRTNGTITIIEGPGPGESTVASDGFSAVNLVTGETLISAGALFRREDASGAVFSGSIVRSSSLLGDFTDTYLDLRVDVDGNEILGAVETTVQNGLGEFRNLQALRVTVLAATVNLVDFTFRDGSTAGFAVAPDLCQPCVTSDDCSNPGLGCFPCGDNCTGEPSRCSVRTEVLVDCGDGGF